ncbi:hypothetical protein VTJ04DRAFT_7491 [Mycothermus thermophilus]|uniref:uncharacterized protein n=1 Tax=Humicola insolens TaxID=85995 RepID=UPI0037433F9D
MSVPTADDPFSAVRFTHLSGPVDLSKPYDPSTLAGKTIVITGGASGFGAAFARHWAAHGANLILGDVNDALGESLVAELRSSPTTKPDQLIAYQHCDVTSWAEQVSLFRFAVSASPTKGIDCVVAGAGIVENGDPSSGTFDNPLNLDSSDGSSIPPPPRLKVLAVNLTGVMYTVHLALHYLTQNLSANPTTGDGHIILISSIAGILPLPGQTEYTVSKHAVMGLFRALRGTAGVLGPIPSNKSAPPVRVNVLCPYFVQTPLLTPAGRALLSGQPLGELQDVVDAATRLAADKTIRGRALAIGPRMRVVDVPVEEAEVVGDEGGHGGYAETIRIVEGQPPVEGQKERVQGIWEIYGQDYYRVETFLWRYLAMMNLVRGLRGWVGVVKDLLGFLGFGARRK